MKKYKYSRKPLAKKIYDVICHLPNSLTTEKMELHEIKLELLAQSPTEKKTITGKGGSRKGTQQPQTTTVNSRPTLKPIAIPKNIKYLNSDLKRWARELTDRINLLSEREKTEL